jgi:uncharacterized membrane protein YidH (DUF202 family)
MSEHSDRPAGNRSERTHTAGAFDIRTLIAMLIGLYGLILVVVGIVNHSDADLRKPDGININLWTGIGMVIAGAAFEAWALWRPVEVPPEGELRDQEEQDGRPQGHS